MLQNHSNIKRAVINDINPKLTTCYQVVKNHPHELINSLSRIQDTYYALTDEDAKREFFLAQRKAFNDKQKAFDDNRKAFNDQQDALETATLFIFLNRTCFNGLYRENKAGDFNVPFGKYAAPTICDADTILSDSELLQRVEILTGDYRQTLDWAQGNSFFYFDPPYRPLSDTSSFNDYTKQPFNDEAQVQLKEFCDQVSQQGHCFMLSNSDCMGKGGDPFFDNLYADYPIERVWAKRNVNANASKRGKLTEIVVRNYPNTKSNTKSNTDTNTKRL